MKNKYKYYCISFLVFFIANLFSTVLPAQEEMAYKNGEFILQLKEQENIDDFLEDCNNEYLEQTPDLCIKKCLSLSTNIWLVSFDTLHWTNLSVCINNLKNRPAVEHIQANHFISHRAFPDDPHFGKQWYMLNGGGSESILDMDTDASEAWDITTGGLTANGDTIVVTIIDNGIDSRHPDFKDRIWYNRFELPGNGIDDDDNGYIDDYRGWNFKDDNNNIDNGGTGSSHGTAVAGIIGAAGNDGTGICGINWNVRMMILKREPSGLEDEVIAAYAYVLEMRSRYNHTGGKEGAFVVATNSSWGIDFALADDYPLWCSMYAAMGKEGILSVAATANQNVDVDVTGDMPGTCASPYLLNVTALNKQGKKDPGVAYGKKYLDLVAPGIQIMTTANNGEYGYFDGTSAAAPQVAGAIALLYAIPHPLIAQSALDKPAETAELMYLFLINGSEPLEVLPDYYMGSLNIRQSMDALFKHYGIDPETSFKTERKDTDTPNSLQLITARPNPCCRNGESDMDILFRCLQDIPSAKISLYNIKGYLLYQAKLPEINTGLHLHTIDNNIHRGEKGILIIVLETGNNLYKQKPSFLKILKL